MYLTIRKIIHVLVFFPSYGNYLLHGALTQNNKHIKTINFLELISSNSLNLHFQKGKQLESHFDSVKPIL